MHRFPSPLRTAFPVNVPGRRPRPTFRGLPGLHSRYGPPDRSSVQDGLCHRASTPPVTQRSRRSANRSNRLLSVQNPPLLGIRALVAHTFRVEFTWIFGARDSATFRHSSLASHSAPIPGATPPARNEWPIITPSAEDKPVEIHLQRRGTTFFYKGTFLRRQNGAGLQPQGQTPMALSMFLRSPPTRPGPGGFRRRRGRAGYGRLSPHRPKPRRASRRGVGKAVRPCSSGR